MEDIKLNDWQTELFEEMIATGKIDINKIPKGHGTGKTVFFNEVERYINSKKRKEYLDDNKNIIGV